MKKFAKIRITRNDDAIDAISLPTHFLPVSTILPLRKLFGEFGKKFLLW